MRLWHVDLIPYLPRRQLLSQWRECMAIARNLAEKGTPNHVLVNRILDYAAGDFSAYGICVQEEMAKRGCEVSADARGKFYDYVVAWNQSRGPSAIPSNIWEIFPKWHNDRYLRQCLFNLQEKHDCGAISGKEWEIIEKRFSKYLK